MARSSTPKYPPPATPALRVSRAEAAAKIQEQINEGEILLLAKPSSADELNDFRSRRRIWFDYNKELLNQLFTSSAIAEEYSASVGGFAYNSRPNFFEQVEYDRQRVQESLTRLRSIFKRLELFPCGHALSPRDSSTPKCGDDVFLVHGHNNEAKETVARFLEHLGLKVTILHEQPDRGRTIIEKFEHYAPVGYAVVLLTGDDKGAAQAMPDDLKVRARQNVVLELGYFLGAIGRTRVCPLLEDGVEVPSDLNGVIYVPFDTAGAWKLRLAKEIKAAGIEVDLDRIV